MEARNTCPGCASQRFAGIIWPTAPDADATRSWAERCTVCRRYANDIHAARHAAARLGSSVALARTLGGRWRLYVLGRSEREPMVRNTIIAEAALAELQAGAVVEQVELSS